MKIIRNSILPIGRNFSAINLFGILFVKRGAHVSERVMNHERIHTAQMRELGYLPFYLLYVLEWFVRLIQHKGNAFAAYKSISHEAEAYNNDHDMSYLQHRRHFAEWR